MTQGETTVLVVDDELDNRDLLSRRLARRGYRALMAEDGHRALEILASEPVHLVLLDVRMPGIDGVETVRRARETYPPEALAVIMVSAEGDSKLVAEALDAGADDYVTKPVDLPVLLARIRARLRTCTGTGAAASKTAPEEPPTPDPSDVTLDAPVGGSARAGTSPGVSVSVAAPEIAWGDTDVAIHAATAAPTRPLPTAPDRSQTLAGDGARAGGEGPITESGTHAKRRVIAGKYRVGKVIGKGGFGAVFRGMHVDLETELAIKVLDRSMTTGAAALERFRREGVAACRVQHPNAVKVFDFGVEPDGMAYLIMELLCGEGLDERMRRRQIFSAEEVCDIAEPICDVLEFAHRQSVVHRDLKPANIFIHRRADTGAEIVKVMDFGVARLADTKEDGAITATGAVVGTPAFVAPETVVGQPSTGASDVYSLGVMLYVMLCGRHPYFEPGERPKPVRIALAHVQRSPPPVDGHGVTIAPAVAAVIHAALAKNPKERPRPGEFAARLRAAVNENPTP